VTSITLAEIAGTAPDRDERNKNEQNYHLLKTGRVRLRVPSLFLVPLFDINMARNPIYALCWILLLFFIAWPVAALCSGLWIILQVRPPFGIIQLSVVP
jgi:hypothetical protein